MGTTFKNWFIRADDVSTYEEYMKRAVEVVQETISQADGPYHTVQSEKLFQYINGMVEFPEHPISMHSVLEEVQEVVLKHSLNVSDPRAMAHLHCPPILPSLAAEVFISAFNQSMDSWDQSPSATYVEEGIIGFLRSRIGYTENGDGTFTSGGTQSNYMALLLARNWACKKYFSTDVSTEGLPYEASKLRMICSKDAHFTVQKSAAQLGLGTKAVVPVETNTEHQLDMYELGRVYEELIEQGLIPFALVATAGTTDFGAIDPISELAEFSDDHELWLHVDAAYGGAMLFSHAHSHLLEGLERADSITIDFHKQFYQAISCGALFVQNKRVFESIQYHADYLNRKEDRENGMINLVDKSIQTTRRFDALKLYMTFKMMGLQAFGDMLDYTINLAVKTANLIEKEAQLLLVNRPTLNAIVFRYEAEELSAEQGDVINELLQEQLYHGGELILAKTKYNGKTHLKMTMLNPLITIEQMRVHIQHIIRAGSEIKKGMKEFEYSASS